MNRAVRVTISRPDGTLLCVSVVDPRNVTGNFNSDSRAMAYHALSCCGGPIEGPIVVRVDDPQADPPKPSKTKVADLEGARLDYWVAMADGERPYYPCGHKDADLRWLKQGELGRNAKECPRYSSDWSQGGPIIEREQIETVVVCAPTPGVFEWRALWFRSGVRALGSTPLVAAMRCFVARKFGEEIPHE